MKLGITDTAILVVITDEECAAPYQQVFTNTSPEFSNLQKDIAKKYYMAESQTESDITQYPPSPVSSSYSELTRSNMVI